MLNFRKSIFLLPFICFSFCMSSQSIIGLSENGLTAVNISNCTATVIGPEIPNGGLQGGSTFDKINNRYIYLNNENNCNYVVVIDATKGNILQSIKTTGPLMDIEYCEKTGKVYGLDPVNLKLISLDLATNEFDTVANLPLDCYHKSFGMGISTFDQKNGLYYHDARGSGTEIFSMNVLTGAGVVYSVPNWFSEIQYSEKDDKIYGMAYHSFMSFDLKTQAVDTLIGYASDMILQGETSFDEVNNIYYIPTYNSSERQNYLTAINPATRQFSNCVQANPGLFNPEFSPSSVYISSNSSDERILVYPNPFVSSVSLSLDAFNGQTVIQVFNQTGKEVKNRVVSDGAQSSISIDLSGLQPGMYTIQANDGKKKDSYRIFKLAK